MNSPTDLYDVYYELYQTDYPHSESISAKIINF